MSITHLPASASADEICAALADDGCVVVDNVVRPEVMDEVAAELRPFAEKTPIGADDFSRPRDQLSTPSHADNLDRPRRAGPDDSSRPVGLRFFPVSPRLRGSVQHNL